jgi:hypothetical protein
MRAERRIYAAAPGKRRRLREPGRQVSAASAPASSSGVPPEVPNCTDGKIGYIGGVRPSSGAATSECTRPWKNATPLRQSRLAAPEDAAPYTHRRPVKASELR